MMLAILGGLYVGHQPCISVLRDRLIEVGADYVGHVDLGAGA